MKILKNTILCYSSIDRTPLGLGRAGLAVLRAVAGSAASAGSRLFSRTALRWILHFGFIARNGELLLLVMVVDL